MKRLANKIKFFLERIILKGAGYQLLMIAMLIGLISILGGMLLRLSDPGVKGYGEAVWWAFLRLTDPGYLGDDQGALRRLISTVITVLGYVVFLGSLVAIMTQWLNSTIRKFEAGITPITLKGHFLILGWTNRTKIIVREILLNVERVRYFLKSIKKSKLHIVILVEDLTTNLVLELKTELGPLWDESIIKFRSGNPLRIEDLKRVDYLNAGVIIIPGANYSYGGSENIDTRTLKIIISIATLGSEDDNKPLSTCPDLVCEIFDSRKVSLFKNAYSGSLELVVGNSFISRLIAQNIRHKGLSIVYSELLSNEDNELYLRYCPEFNNRTFGELVGAFPRGILVGILREENGAFLPFLNPERDFIITEMDQLIVLGQNLKETEPEKDFIPEKLPTTKEESLTIRKIRKKLLILGWSNKIPSLLTELNSYDDVFFEIENYSTFPIKNRESFLERHQARINNISLQSLEADYAIPSFYNKVNPEDYDNIIMMANERLDSGEEADARSIMGYMILQNILSGKKNRPDIIVELMDPDNEPIIRNNIGEVIISPLLLSHISAQIAMRKGLNSVFEELFTYGGADISFRKPDYYDISGKEFLFKDIELTVFSHNDILLGLLRTGETSITKGDLILNPPKESRWELTDSLKLVVLSTFY